MKELWQQAVAGDKRAEDAIFKHLRERFTVIAGLSICKEDAKDLAHEACLAVLEGYKKVGSPYQYSAWAQRILKNKIADYFQNRAVERKLFTERESFEDVEGHSQRPDHIEVMLMLQKCLDKLAAAYPRYARALHLRQEGYETDIICHKLKVTRSNLYVLLNRGRVFLRECMSDGKSN